MFVAAEDDDPTPEESFYGRRGAAFDDLEQARAYFEGQPVIYPDRVGECLALLERLADHGFEPKRRLHHRLPVYEDSIQLVFRADLYRTRAATFLKKELLRYAQAMPPVL